MTDMSKFSTPGQLNHRAQWIVDAVRANQKVVGWILVDILSDHFSNDGAKSLLAEMHKSDRDAILQPGGILTDKQIKLLNSPS